MSEKVDGYLCKAFKCLADVRQSLISEMSRLLNELISMPNKEIDPAKKV